MSYRVLSDINATSVIMPTALVGTVLLTLRGRGVGMSEMVRRIEWLSNRVTGKGGRVAHQSGQSRELVVQRALEVLGSGLVGKVEGLAEDTYFAVDRFQLSFYRNMTIHLFIAEALVCVSLYTKVKLGSGPDVQRISFEELYTQVNFLSQVSHVVTICLRARPLRRYSSSNTNSYTPYQAWRPICRRPFTSSRPSRSYN